MMSLIVLASWGHFRHHFQQVASTEGRHLSGSRTAGDVAERDHRCQAFAGALRDAGTRFPHSPISPRASALRGFRRRPWAACPKRGAGNGGGSPLPDPQGHRSDYCPQDRDPVVLYSVRRHMRGGPTCLPGRFLPGGCKDFLAGRSNFLGGRCVGAVEVLDDLRFRYSTVRLT